MPTSRQRLIASRVAQLARDLSPRERCALRALATMHIATSSQVARVVYPAQPTAERLGRRCLLRLTNFGLVRRFPDRSRDRQVGAPGYVHALTAAGLRLAASQNAPGARQRHTWRPSNVFLAHRLAISELYAQLTTQQATGGPVVRQFLAEPDCWRTHTSPAGHQLVLRPDALVRLQIGAQENSWFIEIDRSTENRPGTIAAKCQAYAAYERSSQEQRRHGVFPGVAFIVPDEPRATWIRRVISRQPTSQQPLFVVTVEHQVLATLAQTEVDP